MLKRELKINFKSLIIWSTIAISLCLIVFLVYPSIINSDSHQSMDEMLKMFPDEVLKAFNMDITGIDSVFGWFKTEGAMFIAIIGGLYSSILGATILVKEENDKTIEFLYSKPVKRSNIVTAKIVTGIVNIFIFTTIVTIFNLCGMAASNDLDLVPFLLITVSPIFIYYMLFFISLFISTFLRKTKQAMSIGIAVVFISYFLQMIGNMSESIEFIKYFSVFEFVSTRYIILNNSLDMKYILIGLGIIALCIFGTYKNYRRKELV